MIYIYNNTDDNGDVVNKGRRVQINDVEDDDGDKEEEEEYWQKVLKKGKLIFRLKLSIVVIIRVMLDMKIARILTVMKK